MNQRPHILVIEDDVEIRSLLRDYLAREGFRVDVGDGGAALDRFRATLGEPDLVCSTSCCGRRRALDLPAAPRRLSRADPDADGQGRGYRSHRRPRDGRRRLSAKALHRASWWRHPRHPAPRRGAAVEGRRFLVNATLSVDLDKRHVAHADGSELSLTSAEFDLLGCFLARPNRVLSREQLMDWTRGRQPIRWIAPSTCRSAACARRSSARAN